MGLFSKSQVAAINEVAKKSKAIKAPTNTSRVSSVNDELIQSSKAVEEYFKDSKAILITTKPQLHDYVTAAISVGIVGIDTETTGLDRNNDYIVGASLYYPGGVECYIAMKHRVPVFETPYNNQLSYKDVADELYRFVEHKTKLVFANANYDLYMIWKDLNVDLDSCFYYDVILAWRCMKEDELHNGLKELYNKYVLKGKGDPKRFSDFFSPKLFPYSKPDVAKLYAANDAKITYDLYVWQYQYSNPKSEKCKKNHLENIAQLIWNLEFPLVHVCQTIERTGMYIDQDMGKVLHNKYSVLYEQEFNKLGSMVDEIIENNPHPMSSKKPPFTSSKDFNPKSTTHVQYLLYTLLGIPKVEGKMPTGKEFLNEVNLPVATQIAKVRSLATNINTFVDKLPDGVAKDGRIHADFKQIGAACVTGDTVIWTYEGPKHIEDIYEESFGRELDEYTSGEYKDCDDLQLYNKYGDLEKVSSIVGYYNQPVVTVHLSNGSSITGTYNHLVLCVKSEDEDISQCLDNYTEFRTLSSIKEDDIIVCMCDDTDFSSAGYEYAYVTHIDFEDNSNVYDVVMPQTHSFVGNGIVNHNTGRMSSAAPNLQNIPSKLNDIRHLFRGDPKRIEDVSGEVDGNEVTFKLRKFSKVATGSNELSFVNDLTIGSSVIIDKDGMSSCLKVSAIKPCYDQKFVYVTLE